MSLCVQPSGVTPRWHRRTLCSTHVPTIADSQAGSFHAGAQVPAYRHAAHDGQRCDVLRLASPLHLYIQVRNVALRYVAFRSLFDVKHDCF